MRPRASFPLFPGRPVLRAALCTGALLVAGCAQTSPGETGTLGGPADAAPSSPDQPVGGRAILRPVPPGQNLPGGDPGGGSQ